MQIIRPCISPYRAHLSTCPAKDASLHCVTAALRGSGPDTIPDPPTGHTLKLLVHSAYVGAILGKGASSVKEVEGASGARVQVHHGERHPLSGPTEEVIKVCCCLCCWCDVQPRGIVEGRRRQWHKEAMALSKECHMQASDMARKGGHHGVPLHSEEQKHAC